MSITQLSHTDSGMIFSFINHPKTKQPAQNPSIDSNDAKKPIIPIKYLAEVGESKAIIATVADAEITSPTNCANLLGGPGTSLVGDPNIGTMTLVARRPIGLKVGPVKTLAKNPYVMKMSNSSFSVITKIITNSSTTPATDLAA